MRRAELAAALREPLAERIDEYLDLESQIAERRLPDRFGLAREQLGLLLPWGSLAAGPDEREEASRLLIAALVQGPAPSFAWYVLREGGLAPAVREQIAILTQEFEQREGSAPRPSPAPSSSDLPRRLRSLAARLRVRGGERSLVSDVAAVARELQHHEAALGIDGTDDQMGLGAAVALSAEVAATVLGVPARQRDEEDSMFPMLATALLAAVDKHVAHDDREADINPLLFFRPFDDPDDEMDDVFAEEGEEEEEGDELEDEQEIGDVARRIRHLDRILRTVEEPADAAWIARGAAQLLTINALLRLENAPPLDVTNRLRAAALVSDGDARGAQREDEDEEDNEDDVFDTNGAHITLERTVAALEADLGLESRLR